MTDLQSGRGAVFKGPPFDPRHHCMVRRRLRSGPIKCRALVTLRRSQFRLCLPCTMGCLGTPSAIGPPVGGTGPSSGQAEPPPPFKCGKHEASTFWRESQHTPEQAPPMHSSRSSQCQARLIRPHPRSALPEPRLNRPHMYTIAASACSMPRLTKPRQCLAAATRLYRPRLSASAALVNFKQRPSRS